MTRRRKSSAFALSDAALAPAVIWMRMPILVAEAFSPASQAKPETVRAVSEKLAAAAEGMASAQMSLATSMWGAWFDLAAGKHPSAVAGTAFRNAQRAAERPFKKRVRANFRRLKP